VESFRPGVLDRLGLGYESLKAQNPRLVLCSLSGYGQRTPMADVAGHDLNYQARAGLLALTAQEARGVVPGVQTADIGGALHGAVGVLAALLHAQRSGQGQHLDLSMTRSATGFLAMEMPRRGLQQEAPGEGLLTGGLPYYHLYETQDGRMMALG